MFAKWFEEYQKLSQKTQFISQLGAFLIASFAFLSLYDWFQLYLYYPNHVKEYREISILFDQSLLFQLAILVIFSFRFVLLLFKTRKANRINEVSYLIGLILVFSYWYISSPVRFTSPNILSKYPEIFVYTSRGFDFVGYLYLVVSPLKKMFMIIIALIRPI